MAGPYSTAPRGRVLTALEAGQSPAAAAKRFALGRSAAHRWMQAAHDEGRREAIAKRSHAVMPAKPTGRMGGGPAPRISGAVEAAPPGPLGGEDDHLTLAQRRGRLAERTGTRVHPWAVGRAPRRAGRTPKKRTPRAAEQGRPDVVAARQARRTATDGVGGISPERPVCLDACGVLANMARPRGRSPRGTRAYAPAPFGRWTRVTAPGAIGAQGPAGQGTARPLGLRPPPPARLLARPHPDRARLGESEERPAPRRGSDCPGAARGGRPGAGHHHAAGRGRVLPPLRPQQLSQLTCGLL